MGFKLIFVNIKIRLMRLSKKIRMTWGKAFTVVLTALLFGLILKGIDAISPEHDAIWFMSIITTTVTMIISILVTMLGEVNDEE